MPFSSWLKCLSISTSKTTSRLSEATPRDSTISLMRSRPQASCLKRTNLKLVMSWTTTFWTSMTQPRSWWTQRQPMRACGSTRRDSSILASSMSTSNWRRGLKKQQIFTGLGHLNLHSYWINRRRNSSISSKTQQTSILARRHKKRYRTSNETFNDNFRCHQRYF